jgi:hypothetical protein
MSRSTFSECGGVCRKYRPTYSNPKIFVRVYADVQKLPQAKYSDGTQARRRSRSPRDKSTLRVVFADVCARERTSFPASTHIRTNKAVHVRVTFSYDGLEFEVSATSWRSRESSVSPLRCGGIRVTQVATVNQRPSTSRLTLVQSHSPGVRETAICGRLASPSWTLQVRLRPERHPPPIPRGSRTSPTDRTG